MHVCNTGNFIVSPIRHKTAASFLVNLITQENLHHSFEPSKTK